MAKIESVERIVDHKIPDESAMKKEDFDDEIKKGIDDLNAGRYESMEKVFEDIKKDYNI